jgi:hypothetical protein
MSISNPLKIRITLPLSDWHDYSAETLWATPIGDNEYVLDNSPLFANELSYKDTIYAVTENDNDFPEFKCVTKRGGHSTYRIILESTTTLEKYSDYIKPLNDIGCTFEGFKERQYALDIPPETDINKAFELLQIGEKDKVWFFESSHIGHHSSS